MILEASRKDDLISLLYMLIYLKNGSLPWSHFLAQKMKTSFQEILKEKVKFMKMLKNE